MAATAKSEQLQIRVSSAEKAEIQRRARQAGLDMSGYVLGCVLPATAQQFKGAVIACGRPESSRFGFADLNTLLTDWTAAELAAAVTEWHAVALTPYAANYVAAMVELACARRGLRAPVWTRDVAPLSEPAFASSLVSLRLHLLTHSPSVFRRRNIFVDSSLGAQV